MNAVETVKVQTTAILFGRGGQHGAQSLPRKNLIPLLGRPVMVYPLLAAVHSRAVDRLYVSTDDAEIAEIGREFGAEIIHRPDHLATKDSLMEDAIAHGYSEVKRRLGKGPNYVVILMCNAPNVLAKTIDQGSQILHENPLFDSVITASRLNMFAPLRARRVTSAGTLKPYVPFDAIGDPSTMNSNRNSTPDVYFGDSGMTFVRGHCLEDMAHNLLPCPWMGKEIGFIEQLPGGGDIDASWQISVLEHWLNMQGFSESSTPYD